MEALADEAESPPATQLYIDDPEALPVSLLFSDDLASTQCYLGEQVTKYECEEVPETQCYGATEYNDTVSGADDGYAARAAMSIAPELTEHLLVGESTAQFPPNTCTPILLGEQRASIVGTAVTVGSSGAQADGGEAEAEKTWCEAAGGVARTCESPKDAPRRRRRSAEHEEIAGGTAATQRYGFSSSDSDSGARRPTRLFASEISPTQSLKETRRCRQLARNEETSVGSQEATSQADKDAAATGAEESAESRSQCHNEPTQRYDEMVDTSVEETKNTNVVREEPEGKGEEREGLMQLRARISPGCTKTSSREQIEAGVGTAEGTGGGAQPFPTAPEAREKEGIIARCSRAPCDGRMDPSPDGLQQLPENQDERSDLPTDLAESAAGSSQHKRQHRALQASGLPAPPKTGTVYRLPQASRPIPVSRNESRRSPNAGDPKGGSHCAGPAAVAVTSTVNDRCEESVLRPGPRRAAHFLNPAGFDFQRVSSQSSSVSSELSVPASPEPTSCVPELGNDGRSHLATNLPELHNDGGSPSSPSIRPPSSERCATWLIAKIERVDSGARRRESPGHSSQASSPLAAPESPPESGQDTAPLLADPLSSQAEMSADKSLCERDEAAQKAPGPVDASGHFPAPAETRRESGAAEKRFLAGAPTPCRAPKRRRGQGSSSTRRARSETPLLEGIACGAIPSQCGMPLNAPSAGGRAQTLSCPCSPDTGSTCPATLGDVYEEEEDDADAARSSALRTLLVDGSPHTMVPSVWNNASTCGPLKESDFPEVFDKSADASLELRQGISETEVDTDSDVNEILPGCGRLPAPLQAAHTSKLHVAVAEEDAAEERQRRDLLEAKEQVAVLPQLRAALSEKDDAEDRHRIEFSEARREDAAQVGKLRAIPTGKDATEEQYLSELAETNEQAAHMPKLRTNSAEKEATAERIHRERAELSAQIPQLEADLKEKGAAETRITRELSEVKEAAKVPLLQEALAQKDANEERYRRELLDATRQVESSSARADHLKAELPALQAGSSMSRSAGEKARKQAGDLQEAAEKRLLASQSEIEEDSDLPEKCACFQNGQGENRGTRSPQRSDWNLSPLCRARTRASRLGTSAFQTLAGPGGSPALSDMAVMETQRIHADAMRPEEQSIPTSEDNDVTFEKAGRPPAEVNLPLRRPSPGTSWQMPLALSLGCSALRDTGAGASQLCRVPRSWRDLPAPAAAGGIADAAAFPSACEVTPAGAPDTPADAVASTLSSCARPSASLLDRIKERRASHCCRPVPSGEPAEKRQRCSGTVAPGPTELPPTSPAMVGEDVSHSAKVKLEAADEAEPRMKKRQRRCNANRQVERLEHQALEAEELLPAATCASPAGGIPSSPRSCRSGNEPLEVEPQASAVARMSGGPADLLVTPMIQHAARRSPVCFGVTGMELTMRQMRIIRNLGATWTTEWTQEITHLIADTFRRTTKMVCAICRGVSIVSPDYLNACHLAGDIVDPVPFILQDRVCEAAFARRRGLAGGYALSEALKRVREHGPLLMGISVYCFPSVVDKRELPLLVEAAGGEWLHRLPGSAIPSDASRILLLGDRTKTSAMEQQHRKDHKVYDIELLREAACTQQLRRSAYRLR